ncbi:MAG: alpha/beta hydrolase [Mesorhizobium sp.]|uniref:alpha/beta hydrolase family protein n=1 Tax=Mesorhizobium sp. TaxID=1871066 RepID=UPI000FE9D526|nr:alpha/beta fold hydrolase [Mesorhizobium sp.]RWI57064.1 MAG: alpha/beta hydrolase [Mesorhizobium sp.]
MEKTIAPLTDLGQELSTADPARQDENAAHRRAMPLQRLIGNGMEWADAHALHALSEQGFDWMESAEALAGAAMRRVDIAGHSQSARRWYLAASASLRFGQAALPVDNDRKRGVYSRMVSAFGQAMALSNPPGEKREIPYRGGRLCGWLLLPPGGNAQGVVIVIGGFDGWREEYHSGAEHLLERGLAVFLGEVPGQGETRLEHGLFITADVEQAMIAIVDALLTDPRLGGRVAIWGNSFGGCLASRLAFFDHRIVACCANGGTARPIEVVERFPRFASKLAAMTGMNADTACEIIRALEITDLLPRMRAPFLQLHSVHDRVFSLETAQALYRTAGSQDKRLVVWEDGDHCVYNHTLEKHCLVADWFAERMCRR